MAFPKSSRFLNLWLCGLILILTLLTASALEAAAGDEDIPAAGSVLNQIWADRSEDLGRTIEEADRLYRNALDISKPMSQSLKETQSQINSLLTLYQISRAHPVEQLTLLMRMEGLSAQFEKNRRPLTEIAETIKQRLEEVEIRRRDIGALGDDGEELSSDEKQMKTDYVAGLDRAASRLRRVSGELERLLAPAKSLAEKLQAGISVIETELPETWKGYYLTSAGGNLETLTSTPAALASWFGSLSQRSAFLYPQNWNEWFSVGGTILVSALVMGFLGLAILRASLRLPDRWRRATLRILKGGWLWMILGVSILLASSSRLGGTFMSMTILGGFTLIWGLASLSWQLRLAARPELESRFSPLARLYPPAAIGVLLLYSDLPAQALVVVWTLIMLVFLYRVRRLNRRERHEGLGLLEQLAYGCSFYFGLGSLLVALAGYSRLAILLFMLLFALINAVILGNALTSLAGLLSDRLFGKEEYPVRNAVIEALAIPSAWIVSLISLLPWIWTIPGASYLIATFMETGYTVGDASFNFSKILFIAVLFLLFRSLVGITRTSVEHLPQRLPHMERGVIQPFKTLITYGFWAIFILVVLSMLGVNFTSLAVVAGGLSVGVGLGLQHFFSNMVSGLMLIFGRSILVGDYVEVGSAAGTVREVSIRSTVIETPEKALVYVPNSTIMTGQFTNWTRNYRLVRRTVTVGVAYGSDVDMVMRILQEAALKTEHITAQPAPIAAFNDFGASTLDFILLVHIDDIDHAISTLTALRREIERSFRENNIDIAFPQLDVHVRASGEEKTGRK